jgi:hypothetical protein
MSSNISGGTEGVTVLQDCKAEFVAAIHRGMGALMNHCGFSRERASLVLLRELQRANDAATKKRGTVMSLRPTDDEVRI